MSWTRFHQPAKKLSSFLIRNGCHKLASLEPAASQLRLFSLTDPQFGAQGKSSSEIYQHSMAPSEFQFRFHGTSVSNQKQPEQPVQVNTRTRSMLTVYPPPPPTPKRRKEKEGKARRPRGKYLNHIFFLNFLHFLFALAYRGCSRTHSQRA